MIHHGESLNIWLGAYGLAAFIGGLLSGHWWWPFRQRLDEEWDDGHAAGRDDGYWFGYSVGVEDESHGLAYVYDENGDELQSDFKNVPRPDERPSGSEVAGPGHEVRPAGPSPAAGRTEDDESWLDDPDLVRPGRTYSELVMLAAQDTPKSLGEVEPVDWYPEALRRSEDWLAACRAELGLVTS